MQQAEPVVGATELQHTVTPLVSTLQLEPLVVGQPASQTARPAEVGAPLVAPYPPAATGVGVSPFRALASSPEVTTPGDRAALDGSAGADEPHPSRRSVLETTSV